MSNFWEGGPLYFCDSTSGLYDHYCMNQQENERENSKGPEIVKGYPLTNQGIEGKKNEMKRSLVKSCVQV